MEFTSRTKLFDCAAPEPAVSGDAAMPSRNTIAALVTPAGRGAVATVEIHGPDALRHVAALCCATPERLMQRSSQGRLCRMRWRGPDGEPVVVCVRHRDAIEVSYHGGVVPCQMALRDLAAAGVEIVDWRELAQRAAGRPIEAEARRALADSVTARSAGILLDQLHGALEKQIAVILDCLRQRRRAEVDARLARLIDLAELGLHLTVPWRVAIVGRPNVGKSSLMNAIVGFDRAIVHATAGTTRDLVTTHTAVDGWPVEFTDSAGIRQAADALESAGVARAQIAMADSDCQLVVFDSSHALSREDYAILDVCPRAILVVNKTDLPAAWGRDVLPRPHAMVSAQSRIGMERLLEMLGAALAPIVPDAGEPVPFTPRQVAILRNTRDILETGDKRRAAECLQSLVA